MLSITVNILLLSMLHVAIELFSIAMITDLRHNLISIHYQQLYQVISLTLNKYVPCFDFDLFYLKKSLLKSPLAPGIFC